MCGGEGEEGNTIGSGHYHWRRGGGGAAETVKVDGGIPGQLALALMQVVVAGTGPEGTLKVNGLPVPLSLHSGPG